MKDCRKTKRVPVGFDLLYKVEGVSGVHLKFDIKEKCTHMFDLSEGGMAIWTDAPLAVSTQLDITFHVIFKEGQTPPMYAKAKVVYCAPLPDGKKYRLGIAFTKIQEEDKEYIRDLVKIKPEQK